MTTDAFALSPNIHISTTGSFSSEIVFFGIGHTVPADRVRRSSDLPPLGETYNHRC